MLSLVQLLLAIFAIYSTLYFEEEFRLSIPLACLVFMFIISRLDRRQLEKKEARKTFLKTEINKILEKDTTTIKEQDFFTIESLLWPKSEMLLVDAVHSVFKELGFKITTGINYPSVDRVIRIPDTQKAFGLEILMSEKEAARNHPKVGRALQFEKEKKQDEKTLIIASTHSNLPLSERDQMNDVSEEMNNFLTRERVSFITTYQLYQFWQKSKGGEIDIYELFQKIYYHPGGTFFPRETGNARSPSYGQPIQQPYPR